MNVKEFKEYLELFNDNTLIVDVIADYLSNAANTETEIVLQSAFNRLKELAWQDKCKRMDLEQQLTMTKAYLKGELYSDEETARENLWKQIKNIEEVLEENE